MKKLLTILFFFGLTLSVKSQTSLGYVKNSSSFTSGDACVLTGVNVQVYTNTRLLSQLAVGDVIYSDAGATTPLAGGSTWWAYAVTSGGTVNRAVQIDGSGVILQITTCTTLTVSAYLSTTSTADCGNTNFITPLYGAADDLTMYDGKPVRTSALGSTLANGSYTASNVSGGTAVWRFSVAGGTSTVSSLLCCTTNPIADAGDDDSYSLPSPSITLSGSGFDCNGNVTAYAWTRISGPNTPTITTPTSASTGITGVIAGTYVFRLTVTDNSANTGTDDVSITVVSEPLCAPCEVIPILPRMTWDLSGASGEGSQRMNDTLTATGQRKYPSILGAGHVLTDRGNADPRNGNFDFNPHVVGVQADSTSIIMTRATVHPGNTYAGQTYEDYFNLGSGNQRVFFIDLERPHDFDAIYIRTNGVACTNAFEVIITDDPEEVRKAVFEFKGYGSPTIDYTVSLTGATYDSIINIREASKRFVVLRFNPNDGNTPKQGPGVTSIFLYGDQTAGAYTRSAITPDYTFDAAAARDTTQPGWAHSGKVIATPVPLSPANYLSVYFPYNKMFSGYLLVTDSAKANGGHGDTTNKAWNIADTDFKLYLSMYGDPNFLKPSERPIHERENYVAIANSNRRLIKQVYDGGAISNQHIPVDSLGADSRIHTSYGRYAWYYNFIAAVLGNTAPNVSSPFYAYIPLSRIAGDWVGGSGYARGTIDYFIPFNENNADFRPGGNPATTQSSWMPPVAMYAFHDTIQTIWHSLFPGVPFTMQGLAAADYGYILTCEMLGKIEKMDDTYTMCDILDMDEIFVKHIHDINGGCTGNIDQQSVFPGYRRKGAWIQGVLDTMAILSGRWRNLIVKEYSVASNKDFQLPLTGCDFNVLSVPPVPSRPTYRPGHIQGYMKTQQQIIFEGVQGLYRSWMYEAFDLVDTSSIYYQGNDGSQGDINVGSTWFKPGLYYGQQHNNFTDSFRVVEILSDSLEGQYKALYRKVVGGITDSFLIVTMWQSFTDPTGNRTHTLASDVTAVLHKRLLDADATYNGTTVSTTVTAGAISIPSVFEPDYIFFKSPELAAELDDPEPPADPVIKIFKYGRKRTQ
jgi:hypothetical protein